MLLSFDSSFSISHIIFCLLLAELRFSMSRPHTSFVYVYINLLDSDQQPRLRGSSSAIAFELATKEKKDIKMKRKCAKPSTTTYSLFSLLRRWYGVCNKSFRILYLVQRQRREKKRREMHHLG